MYIDTATVHGKKRSYTRHLLRESFREKGKVKHRTLANLSQLTEAEINAMKLAFKHKNTLHELGGLDEGVLRAQQGLSVGAVLTLYQTAQSLGIVDALGNDRHGRLALWQVIARVMDQGSRLSAVRLASTHAACDVLGLDGFDEEDLYANLDWLWENQATIENRLFKTRHGETADGLYLYDVTSSYFEGEHNALAAFGYNRDKKKGKKQIVIGLLCDAWGMPVSIDVFRGNTHDTKTFVDQVHKVISRWGGGEVTFVGDRGMIRGPQIAAIQEIQNDNPSGGIHYISAISKPEIETLLKQNVFQLDLFDETVSEVITEEERYILRRNPARAEEIRLSREQKLQALREMVEKKNTYLKQHGRSREEVALNHVMARAKHLNILPWVNLTLENRVIQVEKREADLLEVSRLDGCYTIRTDLTVGQASKYIVHDRYKDLALVESAFRSSKTVHLEMRPIYLHLEERTRAHAFVVMLAYMIIKTLADKWLALNQTVEEGVMELSQLCATTVLVSNRPTLNEIPIPRDSSKALLEAASISLPSVIPNRGAIVSTKKKLQSERKPR